MWPGIDENTRARRDLAKYAFMLDIGVHAIRSLIMLSCARQNIRVLITLSVTVYDELNTSVRLSPF